MRAQRTQQQREAVGVELYGYQQTLAKLQMALEKAQESYAESNATRCGHCLRVHACMPSCLLHLRPHPSAAHTAHAQAAARQHTS